MAISFECDGCGRQYRVEDHLAGRRVKCRQCGGSMTVPGTPLPGSAVPPPPPVVAPPPVPIAAVWTPPSSGASAGAYAPPPPQPAWTPPSAGGYRYQPPVIVEKEKSGFRWKLWAPLAVVVVGVLGLGGFLAVRVVQKIARSVGTSGGIAAVQVSDFPDRPAMRPLRQGVQFADIKHGDTSRAGLRLWLYLPSTPPGQPKHPDKSLPCVLIAPAGSNMLTGMALTGGDEPEHVPYVKAGFAVVAYELDGHMRGGFENASNLEIARAIRQFMAAEGGVANGKAALEYVLAKVPEVDPGRIYTAGHSSAGTVSLLMAVREPRIKGAIAYAPCYDVEKLQDPGTLRKIDREVSGAIDFARRTSPAKLPPPKCPVFLFHAEDDSVVAVGDTRAYAAKLGPAADVTLSIVPEGEHAGAMFLEGIPRAIEWLKKRGARPYAAPGQTVANAARPPGPPRPPHPPHPGGAPPMPPVPMPRRPQAPPNQPPGEELGALSPDPAMLEHLGDEEAVGDYKIRPPKGWRGFGGGPMRTWRRPSGQGRGRPSSLSVHVSPARPNASVRRAAAENPVRFGVGDLAYCTINGREFARIVREHPSSGTVQYIGYDGGKEITIRMTYDAADPKARDLVEAAARTVR